MVVFAGTAVDAGAGGDLPAALLLRRGRGAVERRPARVHPHQVRYLRGVLLARQRRRDTPHPRMLQTQGGTVFIECSHLQYDPPPRRNS